MHIDSCAGRCRCADAAEKFGSKRGKRLQNLAELQCIFHIGLFVIRNF